MTFLELIEVLRNLPLDFDVAVPNFDGYFTEARCDVEAKERFVVLSAGHVYRDDWDDSDESDDSDD